MIRRVVEVRPLGGHRLFIRFDDEVQGEVDVQRGESSSSPAQARWSLARSRRQRKAAGLVCEEVEPAPPTPQSEDDAAPGTGHMAAAHGTRRPARYGLGIQFEARPDDPELAQLVESTVWINEAHPAYRRALASRSEGYHVALAVALALAPLAVEPAKEHGFLTTFLARWGEAIDRRKDRRRRRG